MNMNYRRILFAGSATGILVAIALAINAIRDPRPSVTSVYLLPLDQMREDPAAREALIGLLKSLDYEWVVKGMQFKGMPNGRRKEARFIDGQLTRLRSFISAHRKTRAALTAKLFVGIVLANPGWTGARLSCYVPYALPVLQSID